MARFGLGLKAFSTIVAWWIGAGWGYLFSAVFVLHRWGVAESLVLVVIGLLYVTYALITPWTRRMLGLRILLAREQVQA